MCFISTQWSCIQPQRKLNYATCEKRNATEDYHAKGIKSISEK